MGVTIGKEGGVAEKVQERKSKTTYKKAQYHFIVKTETQKTKHRIYNIYIK